MAIDPVCGAQVEETETVPDEQYTSQYQSQTMYFVRLIARRRSRRILNNTCANQREADRAGA